MTWIFTPRVERPNQRFPTQAREPPVGEGLGANLNRPRRRERLSPSERRMTIGMNKRFLAKNPNALPTIVSMVQPGVCRLRRHRYAPATGTGISWSVESDGPIR